MKKKRHELILKLIQEHEITTQEELLDFLEQNGFSVTQATVSRDIKELQLMKIPTASGATKYAVSHQAVQKNHVRKFYTIFSQSVVSVDCAGNMSVIKCYAGTANAAGAAIDAMHMPEVVGSLAGDDTLFVLCRDNDAAVGFKAQIQAMLNGDV